MSRENGGKGVVSIAYVAFVAPCDVYLLCGICGFPSSSGSPHVTLALSGAQSGAKGGSFAGDEKVADGKAQTYV